MSRPNDPLLFMPRGRNVQEPPSPCEFVLPEVGTAGLGTTLHLEDPVLCGLSRILGRLGITCLIRVSFSLCLR
jgi:hypothetical protein